MKLTYNKEDDILVIQLASKKIDDTYEANNMLVHVSRDKEPVLIEIIKASQFFSQESRALPREVKREFFVTA